MSEALRRTLAGLLSPDLTGLSPGPCAAYKEIVRRLRTLSRTHAGLLASVARRPSVGTLVSCLADPTRMDVDRDAVATQLVGALAVDLAAGGAGSEWSVDAFAPGFTSWAHRGWIELPDDADRLVVHGERIEVIVNGRSVPISPRLEDVHGPLMAPIDGDVVLCRADDNPLAHVEAHPDKTGNAIALGGKPVAAWTTALRQAISLVQTHAPTLHADIAIVLQQVIPVGYDPARHVSASYADNLGTIYCSLHDDPMTMAEAVIHEVSHSKLNALLRSDPVLDNAFTCTVSSPIRPDPRPLHGVLLAVHAFVAVEHLYAAMVEAGHPWSQRPDFRRRHEEIRANNRAGRRRCASTPSPPTSGLDCSASSWSGHSSGTRSCPSFWLEGPHCDSGPLGHTASPHSISARPCAVASGSECSDSRGSKSAMHWPRHGSQSSKVSS